MLNCKGYDKKNSIGKSSDAYGVARERLELSTS